MRPLGLQHARLFCPSPSPGVCSNSCPLGRWCHPTISSSVVPFPSCPQSFQASGSFPMNWLFASGAQSIGASAWVFPMDSQGWFPLGLTGLTYKGMDVTKQKTDFKIQRTNQWSPMGRRNGERPYSDKVKICGLSSQEMKCPGSMWSRKEPLNSFTENDKEVHERTLQNLIRHLCYSRKLVAPIRWW